VRGRARQTCERGWGGRGSDACTRYRCAVERFIRGPYRKHNNNFGFVSEDERNTPQAFSHFTYEASQHRILICDIQGVGDLYTDPQIHSRDGVGFGKGNMGERGIKKFIASHRCNPVCRYLKLPSINSHGALDSGTLPATRYMSYNRVEVVHIDMKDASANKLLGNIVRDSAGDHKPKPEAAAHKKICMCTLL
jgi:hypothetical protein